MEQHRGEDERIFLQRISLVAGGSSAGDIGTGIQRMQRGIGDALRGKGQAADALSTLKISAVDIAELDPTLALAKIGRGLGEIENPALRGALAQEIFGRSAAKLLPLLEDEGRNFAKLQEQLGQNGFDQVGADVENLNDEITGLWQGTKKFLTTALLGFDSLVHPMRTYERLVGDDLPAAAAKHKQATIAETAALLHQRELLHSMAKAYEAYKKAKQAAAESTRGGIGSFTHGMEDEIKRLKYGIDPLRQQAANLLRESRGKLPSEEYDRFYVTVQKTVDLLLKWRGHQKAIADEATKAAARQREVSAQARAIRESVQEPWEKFTFQLNDIALLKMQGAIDELTAGKAQEKAAAEYLGGMPEYREPVLIGSAARGSAAAYESMVKAQHREEMPEDKIRVAVEKAYQEAVKQTTLLTAIKDKEVAKIAKAPP